MDKYTAVQRLLGTLAGEREIVVCDFGGGQIEVGYRARSMGMVGYIRAAFLAPLLPAERIDGYDRRVLSALSPGEVAERLSEATGEQIVAVDDLQYPPPIDGDSAVPCPEQGVRRQSAERRLAAQRSMYARDHGRDLRDRQLADIGHRLADAGYSLYLPYYDGTAEVRDPDGRVVSYLSVCKRTPQQVTWSIDYHYGSPAGRGVWGISDIATVTNAAMAGTPDDKEPPPVILEMLLATADDLGLTAHPQQACGGNMWIDISEQNQDPVLSITWTERWPMPAVNVGRGGGLCPEGPSLPAGGVGSRGTRMVASMRAYMEWHRDRSLPCPIHD